MLCFNHILCFHSKNHFRLLIRRCLSSIKRKDNIFLYKSFAVDLLMNAKNGEGKAKYPSNISKKRKGMGAHEGRPYSRKLKMNWGIDRWGTPRGYP